MTLQLLVGRTGSGKTNKLLEEVRGELLKAPIGDPIVYLVPDQMTFQIEYDLIQTPGLGGMLRAQVFSFTRLAWRILQETGGISRLHLDNVGTNMLIRKIIENRKNDFLLYGKAAEKSGFIDQIENMIHECKRYCITATGIRQQVEELNQKKQRDITLLHKLHDFSIIYDEFEKQLFEKYVDSEDYLQLLAEKIPSSTYLKNATVLIDGFHSFTPQELVVLEKLIANCQTVKMALTLDKPFTHQPHELHLFHMTGKTYLQAKELAERNGQKVEVQVLSKNNRAKRQAIAHIEQNYESRPTVQLQDNEGVLLRVAVNRRTEVEGVAKEILRLVREENYRYRDMAIILRNTSLYHDLLETVFYEYEIPVFIDQKRSMLHHPLIEFIRSALEIVSSGFRYESVFRAVKTDLLFPIDGDEISLREDFDLLENYVLAYGIQGHRWKDTTQKWPYRRIVGIDKQGLAKTSAEEEMEQKIHDLRLLISTPLLQFEKRLKEAKTGTGYAESLYLLLEELNVPGKLEKWRLQTEQTGDIGKAKEHGQVWNSVIDLLDQFVELMGNEELSVTLFQQTIEAGLEALRFALVPPAIDQVVVGDFEHSRFSHIRATFILGINDGVIPAIPTEEGVLNEDEREQLTHHGLVLAPGGKQQLLDEQFLLYLAVGSASDQLWLSYSLANEEGKSLVPSIFIKRIKDLFPGINEQLLLQDPSELKEEEQLDFITTPLKTISYLAMQLQQWKRNYPISPIWWDVYNAYEVKRDWKTLRDRVVSSLFYQNREEQLPSSVSENLYGDKLTASVSRMELFQSCPFSHFASYGLGLQERQIFRLEAPDIGQFFHAALKMMADELQKYNLSWKQLSKTQCMEMAQEVVNVLAPKIQKEILLSSNRYHYLKRKLTDVIGRASLILSEHAKASGFAPVGLELGFGRNGELPAIEFILRNGTKMELVGRIDRVDVASGSRGTYLRIVDYKSSSRALNLAEVYYGLSLQMLTYLDIVLSNSKAWLGHEAMPAGVLYFHVHNPMVKAKEELSLEDIEDELLKSFKMKGLLLGDEEAVRLMDSTIDNGHSKIVSAGLKKTGGFHAYSSIASEDEFDVLRKHIRRTFITIGDEMVNGKVDIAPYQLKDKKPCKFCSFKPVCQFDEALEENTFVTLEPVDDKTILTKLKEEVALDESFYTTKA